MDGGMTLRPNFATPEDVRTRAVRHDRRRRCRQIDADLVRGRRNRLRAPTGVRLTGNVPIRESWRAIFANARIRIQAEQVAHWQSSVLVIHHLTEALYVGDDPTPHGPLHVTHIYTRGAEGWRLTARHASPADDGAQQAMADAMPHTLH